MKPSTRITILLSFACILVGLVWPVKDAVADEVDAMKSMIAQLLIVNQALRNEAAYERSRTHPVCHDS